MSVKKINHIGIIVPSIEEALKPYVEALGLEAGEVQLLEQHKLRVVFLPVGDTQIELIEPLDAESDQAAFLRRTGGGFEHICFETSDLEGELARLKGLGFRLIHEVPITGANNARIAFVHADGFHNVTVELCQLADCPA